MYNRTDLHARIVFPLAPLPADVLALFDLDHTLLTGDCDQAWVEFLIERGVLDRESFERANRQVVDRYRRGEVGVLEFTEFYVSTLAPHALPQLENWRGEYLQQKIMPMIPIAARELVDKHRSSGDLMVLTTAASRFLTAPIAGELGFENLIASEPEMRDGRFTGRVAGTPNMREGKIARLEAWLAERNDTLARFRQSWFYSDSRNDIPLLSRVTHPVAVNADPALAALASEKAWPTLRIR
ncbi:MAG TPA: HAD family hydrolase [Casimicrobiaceae bacterium]|jgi:HAD superfamily hydrolase (TIGR01490 family)|nr:HAD family hydrolase [Casimicrobiaceae bacterium]